ncbi:MAG: hypothetical protein MUE60_02550, partial [Candidatus Eisenbacteria bacterium]|nr:hypothetical protein [Candidatus Eisenbacteria bacterium]
MSCSRQVRAVFLAVAFGTLAGGVAPRQPGAETLDAIAFEYGIVGRTAQCPDSLFLVKDGVTLRSGDQIRITVRRMPDTCFYVILQMSNGDYTLFHAAPGATPADPMIESLRWLMLDDDTGVETIHLVASAEPLTSLERSLAAYDAS